MRTSGVRVRGKRRREIYHCVVLYGPPELMIDQLISNVASRSIEFRWNCLKSEGMFCFCYAFAHEILFRVRRWLKKGPSWNFFNDLICPDERFSHYFSSFLLIIVVILSGESKEEKYHSKKENEKAAKGELRWDENFHYWVWVSEWIESISRHRVQ